MERRDPKDFQMWVADASKRPFCACKAPSSYSACLYQPGSVLVWKYQQRGGLSAFLWRLTYLDLNQRGWCQLGLKNLFGIECQPSPVSRMWCSSEYEPFYVWQKSISSEDSKLRLMKPDIGGQLGDLQMFKFCSLLIFPRTFWTYKVPVCTFLWYLMIRKHIVCNVYFNRCGILRHLILFFWDRLWDEIKIYKIAETHFSYEQTYFMPATLINVF